MPAKKNYHHGDLKNALVRAGAEVLAREGAAGLSLRKVASQAGVSHSAPYAHFADKQALIAAISTGGFWQLYDTIEPVVASYSAEPKRLLVETAWAYVQFALQDPDRFKIMFSSILEKEKEYPDFVQASQENFKLVVRVAEICQDAALLRPGPAGLAAASVWSLLHGFVTLQLEDQLPHTLTQSYSPREILTALLNQITLQPVV
jgi:AcrR family transcriptional regulator